MSSQVPEIYTVEFALDRYGGEFLGKTLMAREIADLVNPFWPNQRIKATATAIGESHGRLGSYNDNVDSEGTRVSRDCGLFQDNIPASKIDSPTERQLRTESLDPNEFMPVAKYNTRWAYQLWATRSIFRDGKLDFRRWSPWVAYTSGWATFPMLYAYHHDKDKNPVGPWVVSGRYLHAAIRGVANWHLLTAKDMNKDEALEFAKIQSKSFGVKDEWCEWKFDSLRGVYYIPGPKPTEPPTAEDNYGYPMKNDGR